VNSLVVAFAIDMGLSKTSWGVARSLLGVQVVAHSAKTDGLLVRQVVQRRL